MVDRFQDPNYLAQVTGRIHQQQPDMLGQLMGGAAGLMGGQGGGNFWVIPSEGSDGWYNSHGSQKDDGGGGQTAQGQYGNIRPASQDPTATRRPAKPLVEQ